MQDSIFTQIIRGDIPAHKVYEDDKTFALMDIHPIQPGHVLVVPKTQVEFVWGLSTEDYMALMITVKKVAERLQKMFTDKPYIGEQIVGMDVPHAHVHVFPFATIDEYLHRPDMDQAPDHKKLAEIAKALAF